jgi:hypothetical protein
MSEGVTNRPAVLRLMSDLQTRNGAAREAMDHFEAALVADEIDGIFASGARFVEELCRECAQRRGDAPADLLRGVMPPSHLFSLAVCHSLLSNGDPAAAVEVLREHTLGPEDAAEPFATVERLAQAVAAGDHDQVVFRLEDHIGAYRTRFDPMEAPPDKFDYGGILRGKPKSRADLDRKHKRILAKAEPGSRWEEEIYGRDDSYYPGMELGGLCAEFAAIGDFERAGQIAGEVLAQARADEDRLPQAVNAYARIGAMAGLRRRDETAVENLRRSLDLVDEALGKDVSEIRYLWALSLALDAMAAAGRRELLLPLSEPLLAVFLHILSRMRIVSGYGLAQYGIDRKAPPILLMSDAARLVSSLQGLENAEAAALGLQIVALHDPDGLGHALRLLGQVDDVHLFARALYRIAYECTRRGDRPSVSLLLPHALCDASLFGEIVCRAIPLYDVRRCWRSLLATERSFRTSIAAILGLEVPKLVSLAARSSR